MGIPSKVQGIQNSLFKASTGQDVASFSASMKKPVAAPLDAPPPPPDLSEATLLAARQAAARRIAAKQGLGSTFLTTPAVGTGTLLGGLGGA